MQAIPLSKKLIVAWNLRDIMLSWCYQAQNFNVQYTASLWGLAQDEQKSESVATLPKACHQSHVRRASRVEWPGKPVNSLEVQGCSSPQWILQVQFQHCILTGEVFGLCAGNWLNQLRQKVQRIGSNFSPSWVITLKSGWQNNVPGLQLRGDDAYLLNTFMPHIHHIAQATETSQRSHKQWYTILSVKIIGKMSSL